MITKTADKYLLIFIQFFDAMSIVIEYLPNNYNRNIEALVLHIGSSLAFVYVHFSH